VEHDQEEHKKYGHHDRDETNGNIIQQHFAYGHNENDEINSMTLNCVTLTIGKGACLLSFFNLFCMRTSVLHVGRRIIGSRFSELTPTANEP
jgi:hypothetical protein